MKEALKVCPVRSLGTERAVCITLAYENQLKAWGFFLKGTFTAQPRRARGLPEFPRWLSAAIDALPGGVPRL